MDLRQHEAHGLTGEQRLVAALLTRMVEDARSQATALQQARQEAIAWLRDREAVAWWLEEVNLEVEVIWPLLLAEAGLTEEA